MNVQKERLRRLALLSSLSDEELIEFSARNQILDLAANETIFRLGDTGCSMYILLEGKVRVFITDRYGKQVVVAKVVPGESFGEMPGERSDVCSATAVTLTESCLIGLNRDSLAFLLNANPDAALPLIAALENQLRRRQQLLAKSVRHRPHEIR